MLIFSTACTKNFLDAKPNLSLVVPKTLKDLQALLDNTDVNNVFMSSLQEMSSDDFYLSYSSYLSISTPMYQNAYLWKKEIYAGNQNIFDWHFRYRQVFYANIVLEELEKMNLEEKSKTYWSILKGSALFYRAFALYQVAQLFCKPYNEATAKTDLGVPIRVKSDINIVAKRVSVEESYSGIISDLEKSILLLPSSVAIKTRPNITAAQGLLARVYLAMSKYPEAQSYSNAALSTYSKLLNYNSIDLSSSNPFPRYNEEVIFHSTLQSTSIFNTSRLIIDEDLFGSYDNKDLRLKLFFTMNAGTNTYKGSYDGSSTFFNGIATNELYLIRAEAKARQHDKDGSLDDLNMLLKNRWDDKVPYPTINTNTWQDALTFILKERRKELIFRGLRWTDLRRLNMDTKYAKTLTRNLNGVLYTLSPNDSRYVFPIPDIVIQLSGIEQNNR